MASSHEKYRRIFWVVIPAVLIIISIQAAVGIYLYVSRTPPPQVVKLPAPQPTDAGRATPELTDITLDENYKSLKVQVQNGRGVAGTAGRAKEFLGGLGYSDVETGNADSFDYPLTTILLKQSNTKYFDSIKNDLSDGYVVDEELQDLANNNEFDVVIIIGLE